MSDNFEPFQKIARLSRECVITEKIDGTNASVFIGEDGTFRAGSRTRWIIPTDDNYGFAKWAYAHEEQLRQLGPGHHFGEWWGGGVQRGYDLQKGEKRFSLFNVDRWNKDNTPACVSVVPTLYVGLFSSTAVEVVVECLRAGGSVAAPGFMDPEGVVIFHTAAKQLFKKTLKKDEAPKGDRNVLSS